MRKFFIVLVSATVLFSCKKEEKKAGGFYERMITRDFFIITNSFQRPIPQPLKFHKAGYYPAIVRMEKQNSNINVILSGFEYRQAS